MTNAYAYSTTFILSREHLGECYDQSVVVDTSIMAYKRAIVTLVFGACLLLFKLVTDYIAFFVISLGVLEVFSTRYRKTWWLWRQMMGKSYKSQVTINIDESGIHNLSAHVEQTMDWQSITALESTALGIIVRRGKAASYLSNSCLDEEAIAYIHHQVEAHST